MLIFYSLALYYFDNLGYYDCWYYPYYQCSWFVPHSQRDEGLGLTGTLVFLMISEFACSIASIVLSCKAYSKCCNTCKADDCCTCLGCCEYDTTPLNYQQVMLSFLPIILIVMVKIFKSTAKAVLENASNESSNVN